MWPCTSCHEFNDNAEDKCTKCGAKKPESGKMIGKKVTSMFEGPASAAVSMAPKYGVLVSPKGLASAPVPMAPKYGVLVSPEGPASAPAPMAPKYGVMVLPKAVSVTPTPVQTKPMVSGPVQNTSPQATAPSVSSTPKPAVHVPQKAAAGAVPLHFPSLHNILTPLQGMDWTAGGHKPTSVSKIRILIGDLSHEQADAVVNTVGTSAKLIAGSVSYALLEAGGNCLQDELTLHHPHGLKVGEIAQTSGGSLKCKKVFHVVLKQWMNAHDEAESLLYRMVTECLQWAVKQNFTTIAFPALGAGFHRFPGNRSADIMFRSIESFLETNATSSLKTVKIVLHPRDDHSKKEFKARKDGIAVVHDNYLSKTVVLKAKTKHSLGLQLHVVIGCLSQLQADVLVNTTQIDLNLSVGAVSRTLLMIGGEILQTECWQKCPSGLTPGQMVQTQGGNLKCKRVFHVVLPSWNQGKGGTEEVFQCVVINCLKEASKQNYTSIGFPVLGAGFLEYPPQKSASLMLKAIARFMTDNPTSSIQTLSVIVAHKDSTIRKDVEKKLDGHGETTSMVATPQKTVYIPGEKNALAGWEVKYFTLEPGCYVSKSPEEHHFQSVASHFFASLAKDDDNRHIFEINKIEYVVNPERIKTFRSAQQQMSKKNASYGKSVLAYHGTAKENVKSICKEGFRLPDHPEFREETDVGWYGNGIYLSPYARFAMNYMQKSKILLLCKVLQGNVFKCENMELGEPKRPGFDSHMDPYGKEIIIYDDDCILPCYIVYFKIRKRFKLKDDEVDPNEDDETELEFLNEMEMHKGEKFPGFG